MCVLKSFRLFKMCLYVKDRFFVESCTFAGIQPCLNTVSVTLAKETAVFVPMAVPWVCR